LPKKLDPASGGRDLAMAVVGTTPTLHQGRGFEIVQWMAEQQLGRGWQKLQRNFKHQKPSETPR